MMAGPKGFEPSISSVTGRRFKPAKLWPQKLFQEQSTRAALEIRFLLQRGVPGSIFLAIQKIEWTVLPGPSIKTLIVLFQSLLGRLLCITDVLFAVFLA